MAFQKSKKNFTSTFILTLFCAVILILPQKAASNSVRPKKAFKPDIVCDSLPMQVNESSGLLLFDNLLWTFNDSGNEPCLYAMDKSGKRIIRKVIIKGAENIDWEAICENNEYIFIGDIGNNSGTRSILTIYKISKDDVVKTTNSSVNAKKITYTYKNYITPIHKTRSEFDAEAMVCIGDSLYIFSKNWEEPYCRVYRMPTKTGHYEPAVFKSIYLEGQVTDASYNVNTNTLILLGYSEYMPFLYYIPQLDFERLTYKTMRRFNYQKLIGFQTEGTTFINDSTIFISSEYNKFLPGTLFKLDLF